MVLSALALAAALLASPDGGATIVRIDTPLDLGTLALVERGLAGAAERGDLLVVELDTPGGEVGLMWRLANLLVDGASRGVRTVAFIDTRALSAGALLAFACESVYARSLARFGSAQPVKIGFDGTIASETDEALREKELSDLRAGFRSVAETNGRPALLAEAMVDSSIEVREVLVLGERRLVSREEWDDLVERREAFELVRTVSPAGKLLNVTGREAVELGLAEGLAESRAELLEMLGLGGVEPTLVLRSTAEDLAGWLVALGPLLLLAGIVLAFVEFKTAGFGVAGLLSIACFALLFFGRFLTGLAELPQIVLVALGIVLVAAEILLVPGSLVAGVIGALCVLVGIGWSLGLSLGGLEHGLSQRILLDEALRWVGASVVALCAVFALSRFLPQAPGFRRLVLAPGGSDFARGVPEASAPKMRFARVGARGRALTALRPVGKVVLDEIAREEWEARSSGPEIPAGEAVVVVELAAGRLIVEREQPS